MIKNDIKRRLSTTLRRERANRGWSQMRVAELSGLDPRHYRKLECCEVNFTAKTLERVCEAFEMDIQDLFRLG